MARSLSQRAFMGCMVLACAILASCTGAGGHLAGPEADQDGQTLTAKPDMARLYLIHGYLTTGKVTRHSGESAPGLAAVYYYDEDRLGPAGQAVVTGLLGGPLAAIVAGVSAANDSKATDAPIRKKRLSITYHYFLDGKLIGDMGAEQYMALDVPPVTYKVYFEQPLGKSVTAPVDLKVGETVFLLSNASNAMGAYWEKCGDDCAPLISAGHRVTADLSGTPATELASH